MTIQIEHTLAKEEAKRRIEQLIERYQEAYKDQVQDLSVEWKDDKAHLRVTARGYSSAGNLEVTESAVLLDFYVPFLLQVFSKKIKSTIQHTIEESLS
jgi:Putative polyhydroxyalkanoic acid system protein (PHA_gran_rgn)